MKIHNMEQKTPEWFKARGLKLTASKATAIGNCGAGLKTYVLEKVAEYFSSGERKEIKNNDTDRGIELEPQARALYELQNDVKVVEVGFVEYNEFVGASPDGLVGDDGLIEIKCPKDTIYFKKLLDDEHTIDSKYIWQMQMQLLVTGRKWCDYIDYNPNYNPSMIITRVYPDEEKQAKLLEGFEEGERQIKEILYKLTTN